VNSNIAPHSLKSDESFVAIAAADATNDYLRVESRLYKSISETHNRLPKHEITIKVELQKSFYTLQF